MECAAAIELLRVNAHPLNPSDVGGHRIPVADATRAKHKLTRAVQMRVGEPVKEHVRRLRLERAAHQLRHSTAAVTGIALDAGYETHESFSRAFRKAFRRSPSAFRQARRIGTTRTPGTFVRYDASGTATGFRRPPKSRQGGVASMAVRFERLPKTRVAFVRHTGPYTEVDVAIRRLARWAGPLGLLSREATIFGIAHDDPEVTSARNLRYDAAIELPESVMPTQAGIGVQTLPAQRYAVTEHRGGLRNLGRHLLSFLRGVASFRRSTGGSGSRIGVLFEFALRHAKARLAHGHLSPRRSLTPFR